MEWDKNVLDPGPHVLYTFFHCQRYGEIKGIRDVKDFGQNQKMLYKHRSQYIFPVCCLDPGNPDSTWHIIGAQETY